MGSVWWQFKGVRSHIHQSVGTALDTMGGVLVEALLFWFLTAAMLGTIGLLLYYARGAVP
jgi:hypothetical protein